MIYFTISKNECGYLIDSISNDINALRNKFPNETIYQSDEPIVSIYVIKDTLQNAQEKI